MQTAFAITDVTFVRAEEFSDLRTYEAPDVLRHVMGFGEVPEKALTLSTQERGLLIDSPDPEPR